MTPDCALRILANRRAIAARPSGERVHRVTSTGVPMPPPAKPVGHANKKLPGGLPPEPYRARNVWSSANKNARSDGGFIGVRLEVYTSHVGAGWDWQ